MRIALVLSVLLAALVVQSSCAGALLTEGSGPDARFRHRELGYAVGYPSVLAEPGWRIEDFDEADLVVRHREGSLWALASQCRDTAAGIELLAGELARAAGGEALGPREPVRQAGLDGVSQRLERLEGDRRLQIKTVTLRGARCTYDWILITPSSERMAELEPRFDSWLRSFEPGPQELPLASGER